MPNNASLDPYSNRIRDEHFPVAVKLQRWDPIPRDTLLDYEHPEIQIIISGSALHTCGGNSHLVEENDVLILHPGMHNAYWSCSEDFGVDRIIYSRQHIPSLLAGVDLGIMHFMYPGESEGEYDPSAPVVKIPPYNHDLYINLVRRISYEIHRCYLGSGAMVPAMFVELIVYLNRGSSVQQEPERLWLVEGAIAHLNDHFRESLDIDLLCRISRMSRRSLFRHFQQTLGMTPHQYLCGLRLSHALKLLDSTIHSLDEIAAECGFYDSSHFSREFRKVHGCSPTMWRRNRNRGAREVDTALLKSQLPDSTNPREILDQLFPPKKLM